jgi:hypothetical protein
MSLSIQEHKPHVVVDLMAGPKHECVKDRKTEPRTHFRAVSDLSSL